MKNPLNTLLLAASSLLAACGHAPPTGAAPPAGAPVEVSFQTLVPRPLQLSTELPGRVTPAVVSEVRPQITGIVVARSFSEGGEVKAGSVLYEVDPASYRVQVEAAQAALAKAEATSKAAELKAARYATLAELKAASIQDREDAESARDQARAEVAAAQATLDADLIDLARTKIRAPVEGQIGKSSVTPGALVVSDQTTALATITQLDPIYVDLSQASAEILALKRERGALENPAATVAVKVVLEDGSSYPYRAELKFSDISVDSSTGSVLLRALVRNPHHDLLPGMFVRAIVGEGTASQALLIPQSALARDAGGRAVVYVVDGAEHAQMRLITTGRAVGTDWQVLSGLAPGDRLIVEGLQGVHPGVPVKATALVPSSADPKAAPPNRTAGLTPEAHSHAQ